LKVERAWRRANLEKRGSSSASPRILLSGEKTKLSSGMVPALTYFSESQGNASCRQLDDVRQKEKWEGKGECGTVGNWAVVGITIEAPKIDVVPVKRRSRSRPRSIQGGDTGPGRSQRLTSQGVKKRPGEIERGKGGTFTIALLSRE